MHYTAITFLVIWLVWLVVRIHSQFHKLLNSDNLLWILFDGSEFPKSSATKGASKALYILYIPAVAWASLTASAIGSHPFILVFMAEFLKLTASGWLWSHHLIW